MTDTDAVDLAVLERIADTLERIDETLTQLSAKLDTANERLAELDRSQWA